MKLEQALNEYLGFETFRPGQKEVIEATLSGENTFVMLPTGTGKTLCYQLSGHLLEGLVLIISPLLSLMQDQVERMKASGEKRVVALNSFLKPGERNTILKSLTEYKFLFMSPEMLAIPDVKKQLLTQKIALFVIDEAHCISKWGHDFRPDYLYLGQFRVEADNPVTMVLTATATQAVRADILKQLTLSQFKEIIYSVNRPNITLHVECTASKQEKSEQMLALIQKIAPPGIIYFTSKKLAEDFAQLIRKQTIFTAAHYHAEMDTVDRITIQQQFISGQIQIICATSAFGMGIDKADIRYVFHFHLPADLESYMQEIGRAGRDGLPSLAILFYAAGDEQIQRQLFHRDLPSLEALHLSSALKETLPISEQRFLNYFLNSGLTEQEMQNKLSERLASKEENLQVMVGYIKTMTCRRSYILNYFNEKNITETMPCCDIDGASLESFYIQNENIDLPLYSWQSYLSYLLLSEIKDE
ncbi:ATP-dependent DNA helicase RecQ [Listeria sp. PSOL-1]|uniref:RecQ family ATP-dependent DNA helicase n=1 Tax=Listeria sp. PSOL-1 TaxID=1844999 RepID=UPI0013D77E3F|nr:ATP-dependent DNA helicase RecQ [Listeria sp. PSOL-1]